MKKHQNKNLIIVSSIVVVAILVTVIVISNSKQGEPYSAKFNPIVIKSNMPIPSPVVPLPNEGRGEQDGGTINDLLKDYQGTSLGGDIDIRDWDDINYAYREHLEGFEIEFPERLSTISGDRVPLIGRVTVGQTNYKRDTRRDVDVLDWWVHLDFFMMDLAI